MGLKIYEHIHDYTDHQSTVFYLYIQNALLLFNTKIFNIPFINLTHNYIIIYNYDFLYNYDFPRPWFVF